MICEYDQDLEQVFLEVYNRRGLDPEFGTPDIIKAIVAFDLINDEQMQQ